MSLGDHLDELRRRVVHSLYGLAPIIVVALVFGKSILAIVIAPVRVALRLAHQPARVVSMAPMETLNTYFKISLIAAALVGSPWLLYQLWLFVAPGLYSREKRFVYFLLPLSVVLMAAGVLFFYFAVLPILLLFLIKFGSELGPAGPVIAPLLDGTVLAHAPLLINDPPAPAPGDFWINPDLGQLRIALPDGATANLPLHVGEGVVPEFRISETVGMILTFCLAFAGGFQTPVVVLLLGWAGIVNVQTLKKHRKHALFGVAVVSALLTPSDPFSMFLMMGALFLLYEFGAILLRFFPASRVAGKTDERRDLAPAPPDAGES